MTETKHTDQGKLIYCHACGIDEIQGTFEVCPHCGASYEDKTPEGGEAKHTPAPWFAGTGWVGKGASPASSSIVVCRVPNYPYGNSEADVKLIAAAPVLLAACLRMQTELIDADMEVPMYIKEAIQKAGA